MTTHAEFVHTGAAAIRRASSKNPMELLVRLRQADTTESFERQFVKWRKLVERDEEYHKAALLHCFRNMWDALDADERKRAARQRMSPEQKAADQALADKLKEKIKRVVLMDQILPINGKRLGDATFGECAKVGGWVANVAKKGRPDQIVGEVLSEEDLRAIKLG